MAKKHTAEQKPETPVPPVRLVPRLTKKLLEENEEFQKEIRRTLNTQVVDPQMVHRGRNLLLIEETKALLSGLIAERKSIDDPEKLASLEQAIFTLTDQMAQSYFEIGDFAAAEKLTSDRAAKKRIGAFRKALEIDDEKHCGHPKYKSHDGKPVPNYFRERDIYSPKHGRIVSIIKCNECDFRNIKPLPQDLAEASRRRADFRKHELG